MSDMLRIDVWRGTESGQFQTFAVPSREHQTVLDVATEMSASTIPLPVGN